MRLKDHLMGNVAFNSNSFSPAVNVADPKAAQQGLITNFEGWVSNSAYLRRNLIPICLEVPRVLHYLPNKDVYIQFAKTLIESQIQTWEGLNATETLEVVDSPMGRVSKQYDISNITREESQPQGTIREKYGRPVQKFLRVIHHFGFADPVTGVPAIVSIMKSLPPNERPTDLLPDMYSFTVLFIEPDPLNLYVEKAFLCTNMIPKSSGEFIGGKDLQSAYNVNDITIEFTAATQIGTGVNRLAQYFLDKMDLTGVYSDLQPAFVENLNPTGKNPFMDVSVGKAHETHGYSAQVAEANAVYKTVADRPSIGGGFR